MLSVATVRSAKGAAGYFAADNYYTAGSPEAAGEWFGKGAVALGLDGKVDQERFEALLTGRLPGGAQVGTTDRHRAGVDLTFSLPKSWSLLALIGGDRRIVDAYREAVKDTLRWTERNAAETRMEVKGREKIVATGNLVTSLFEHDTSRAQDPQVHLHAVIANVTQGPDGKWRALHNDKLWSLNTLLNGIAMAGFRERVEALGYKVGEAGKHGNFEAAGIPRETLMAFSTRRQQILAKAVEIGAKSPQAMHAATLMTRPRKAAEPDRAVMQASWRESAVAAGLDLPGMIAAADRAATVRLTPWDRLSSAVGIVADRGRGLMAALGERLGLALKEPYLPRGVGQMSAPDLAAAHAVASALRHLEQREAAFLRTDVLKAALDTGLPVGVAAVERRIVALEKTGVLVRGQERRGEMITTVGALVVEHRMLAGVEQGRGCGQVYVDPSVAGERLMEAAQLGSGVELNPGQRTAGELLLASSDRIVAVQGVAGAGKTSVLRPVAAFVAQQGRPTLGLAVQNTLVQMLGRETGMEAMTVARFIGSHRKLLGDAPDAAALADARRTLGGALVVVDEASMLSNHDQLALVRLANLIGVGRMAFVGDAKQLGAVDAGKPFPLMQAHGAPTALMDENLRARTEAVRTAAFAAQAGAVKEAMTALAPYTVEAPGHGGQEAASLWLALPPQERERTAIYAAGRRLRAEVNAAVQEGLAVRGEIGPGKLETRVLSRVNLTDEELRSARSYVPGMLVDVTRPVTSQQLPAGLARIDKVDVKTGAVEIAYLDGSRRILRPERLRPRDGRVPIQLNEERSLNLHERDRIRWTDNDKSRGLFNADQAQVLGIDNGRVTIATSDGRAVVLAQGDPMLARLDLAYAMNAHMAQGQTADRGIAVLETRDTKLVNQQTFLVTVTRVRDALTLVVDCASGIERMLGRSPGGKTSAVEIAQSGAPATRGDQRQPPEKIIDMEPGRVRPFEIGI